MMLWAGKMSLEKIIIFVAKEESQQENKNGHGDSKEN